MKYTNNRWLVVSLHLIVWFALFALPYWLTYEERPDVSRVIGFFWFPLTVYAFVFYSNYLVLIDRFLFNRKRWVFVVVNLLLLIAVVYLLVEVRSYLVSMEPELDRKGPGPPRTLFIYLEFIWSVVPLFFALALKILDRWVRLQVAEREAAAEQLQSELQHLKYQLQPHFFFNSLNNIYSLVDISPEKAKEVIHALGKLMRYLLYDTNTDSISLSEEIEFMRKYIELMEIRTSHKTRVFVSFPEVGPEIRIAPLLFISLIENAFKHGTSAVRETEIFFVLQVDERSIRFVSRNLDVPKSNEDKSGSGIGLKNLEKRLELLYPGSYRFCVRYENGDYISELDVLLPTESRN